MDKIEMIVNQLPAPTWNRLRMNESRVAVAVPKDECEPRVALQGSVCLNKQQSARIPGKNCCGCEQMATCPVSRVRAMSMTRWLRLPRNWREMSFSSLTNRPSTRMSMHASSASVTSQRG